MWVMWNTLRPFAESGESEIGCPMWKAQDEKRPGSREICCPACETDLLSNSDFELACIG